MEKQAHLIVTDQLAGALPLRHRLSLKLGCILPDLLVHTYAVGHTWEAARDRVEGRMRRLAAHGRPSCWSYLMLGYILHYVEDFFTWPHNAIFSGSLSDHVHYEHTLTRFLLELPVWNIGVDSWDPAPVDLLVAYLRWLHRHYEAEVPGPGIDLRYILRASSLVAQSYYGIFRSRLPGESALPARYDFAR